MIVRVAPNGMQRPVEVNLSDLTNAVRAGDPYWTGDMLTIPFEDEPTAAEQRLIRRRLMTKDSAEEARVTAYVDGLAGLEREDPDSPALPLLRLLVTERLSGIESDPL